MVREKGKFVKGVSGNPNGRPKKEREENYRAILISVVTPEKWVRICDKAEQQAEKGDGVARKFLADYLIGPPVQENKISGEIGFNFVWQPHKKT